MTIDEVSDRPAAAAADREIERLVAGAEADFANYEMIKDLVDELIDLSLDYRQSGHPGGSRSKVHMLLALLLSWSEISWITLVIEYSSSSR